MTTQSKISLFILGIISLSFFACSQEVEIDPIPSISNPEAYSNYHFNVLGESLAEGFGKEGFQEAFYHEIEKKFDGETSVLFKTLFELPVYPRNDKSSSSLEAFYNIEEESFYPHVYIPNYESLKKKKEQLENPYVVLFVPGYGDKIENHTVFQIQNGSLIKQNFTIKEAFIFENLTLVISLNETVDSEGKLPASTQKPSQSRTKTTEVIDYFFDDMTILERKESGFSGKSEVSIRGWARWTNDAVSNGGLPISTTSSSGNLIRKFTRQEVENQTTRNVNHLIADSWEVEKFAHNNITGPYHVAYVIFERDPWPAQHRTNEVDVCGTSAYMGFRSSDTSYIFEAIYGYSDASCSTSNFWRGHSEVFHPEIRFSTRHD